MVAVKNFEKTSKIANENVTGIFIDKISQVKFSVPLKINADDCRLLFPCPFVYK
jgi:hypothetical protein